MKPSVIVHRMETSAVPILDITAWRNEILHRGRAGRIVTLYGRRTKDDVLLTAVLQGTDNTLEVIRTTVTARSGYHEMTGELPALHCFERELHEQTGVRIAGHPWLKPIRFEGCQQSDMNKYPFYKIEGKEVHEVAVGPIHAGVIEPGSFRFMCEGEQVHHLEIHLGYQHRGVEHRLLEGDPLRMAPLVETIAGDTSIAHTWAYAAAIEALAEWRATCSLEGLHSLEAVRSIALELERIGMHLATLSGLAADIGFLQGATTYGRLRTAIINTTMRLSGSRFGRGAIRPGAGARLTADLKADILSTLQTVQKDVAIIHRCFTESITVRHRLQQTGILTESQASDLGLVGVAARSSGISVDARTGPGQGIYEASPIRMVTHTGGDCWARACVRIEEIDTSLEWISSLLRSLSDFHAPAAAPASLYPSQLAITMVEGWRGEVVHCMETDANGRLAHYKVQDPSLRNWMGLALAVRGNEISDFPICNKSFDLSYCGNDL